jgi:hypothetical protein
MSYEPYSIEVDPDDLDFEDWTIASVEPYEDGEGWSVISTDSYGCGVPNLAEDRFDRSLRVTPEPKVGDTLRVYARFGSPLRGQVLNGAVIWYRNEKQQAEYNRRWREDLHAKQRREFVLTVAQLDKQYEELPEPFKARLDRFRAEDPAFRERAEHYESFVLQQAALLADHFKTSDAVRAWKAIDDYQEQRAQAPEGWSDDHSNNTHGAAIALACALLGGESV